MRVNISELVSVEDSLWAFFEPWMRGAKTRSVKRGTPFTVEVDFLVGLMIEQGHRCAVSGLEFYMGVKRRDPFSPSVDRLDNSRGYEPGNIRIVCLIVNLARSDFGDEALVKMARAIVAARA